MRPSCRNGSQTGHSLDQSHLAKRAEKYFLHDIGHLVRVDMRQHNRMNHSRIPPVQLGEGATISRHASGPSDKAVMTAITPSGAGCLRP